MTLRCDQNMYIITDCTVYNYSQMLHIASVYEEHFLRAVFLRKSLPAAEQRFPLKCF